MAKVNRDGGFLAHASLAREADMTVAAQPCPDGHAASALAPSSKRGGRGAAVSANAVAPRAASNPPVVACLDSFDVYAAAGGCHRCLVLERLGDSLSQVRPRAAVARES